LPLAQLPGRVRARHDHLQPLERPGRLAATGKQKGEDKLMTAVNEWVHVNLRNGKLSEIYKRYNGTELPLEMLV
jgi:ABC-type amino acid transport substrate-binding protein